MKVSAMLTAAKGVVFLNENNFDTNHIILRK